MTSPDTVQIRRAQAADVLAKFKAGEISNREFDARFDSLMADDPVLFQIWKVV